MNPSEEGANGSIECDIGDFCDIILYDVIIYYAHGFVYKCELLCYYCIVYISCGRPPSLMEFR